MQVWYAVTHPHLDGSECGGGADVPVNAVYALDDAGFYHVGDIALESRPLFELQRQPGCWQLLKEQGAVRGITGIFTAPKRRRGRQRLQVRKNREHRAQNWQDLIAIFDSDVDMHAVDEHLPPPPLGAIHAPFIVWAVRDLLARRLANGVGAGAHQVDAQRLSYGADFFHGRS